MDIITGENFEFLCDHFLGSQWNLNYNPRVAEFKEKWIDIELLNEEFDNKYLVFCYTDMANNKEIDLIQKLKLFKNPFILIFHNSDDSFSGSWLNDALKITNLIKIYSENPIVEHSKIIPIPIGIANSMWPHGNLSIWKRIIQNYDLTNKNKDFGIHKNKFIYFNFNIQTNPVKRKECYDIMLNKGLIFSENTNYENYLNELISYKYAICPDGNGIDTHRLWECLYMKVIPICRKSVLVEYFSKCFPIIILDNWESLDINDLTNNYDKYNKWDNYEKLSFSYYKNTILSDKIVPFSHVDNKGVHLDFKLHNILKKKDGFFIELGANDGLVQSNTAFFEKYLDWKGILIEPSINSFNECIKNRPNSICLNNACVSNDFTDEFVYGDFTGHCMSSVDGKRLGNNKLVKVKATTLEHILDEHTKNQFIDFLSLDVEGYEYQVLKGLNLNKYRPKYMLIEIYNNDYTLICDYLIINSYRLIDNFSKYNKKDNPFWDEKHNDYLFTDLKS